MPATRPPGMYLLYSFVLTLLFVALSPYFLYQAFKNGKYSSSFKERLGLLPATLKENRRSTIWVHAVSVGEFLAAKPLIQKLRVAFPESRLVVSTTTLTGQRLARSQSELFDEAIYFPFDWRFSVRRALTVIDPSAVIILETELWPNFLRTCRERGVKTIVVNGRISQRSFRRYRLLGRSFSRAMNNLSLIVMQTEADANRICDLGVRTELVTVCGNLKYDSFGSLIKALDLDDLDTNVGDGKSSLIVAGSTEPGEEDLLLSSLFELRKRTGLERTRLVLAPRRPERFDEVARLVERAGFSLLRRSHMSGGTAVDWLAAIQTSEDSAEVVLLDTIGELASIYRFASVVFVGGSLVPRGGHNILEPAAFAKPVVVGPHTENFHQIVSDFANAGAVVRVGKDEGSVESALTGELERLLTDTRQAIEIGTRARAILLENRGATDCTLLRIRQVLE
jgi:3-deoxy-D-manno-octulosonic-acid transferase